MEGWEFWRAKIYVISKHFFFPSLKAKIFTLGDNTTSTENACYMFFNIVESSNIVSGDELFLKMECLWRPKSLSYIWFKFTQYYANISFFSSNISFISFLMTLFTMPTKVWIVKAMVFPVVMYGCESWIIKKTECWRIDVFELTCGGFILIFGKTNTVM